MMCTAISFHTRDHYFGRNLDLELSLGESIVVVPRNFVFSFRRMGSLPKHHALIGIAYVKDGYPLLYDAVNEHGLGMAALNFPGNAAYFPIMEGVDNISPFEFIPWILAQCGSVQQARGLLGRMQLTDEPFSENLPLSPLHWILADRKECLVIEQTAEGLHVYENPVRILTNNPPFPWHLTNLSNYMTLTPRLPQNTFAPDVALEYYSRGLGAVGLPGDWSSSSRFVRAAYALHHSSCEDTEESSVSQFFHLLSAVSFPRGAVIPEADKTEITVYSCCCNTSRGIYYCTTYDNPCITAVDMRRENLDGSEMIAYPLEQKMHFRLQN